MTWNTLKYNTNDLKLILIPDMNIPLVYFYYLWDECVCVYSYYKQEEKENSKYPNIPKSGNNNEDEVRIGSILSNHMLLENVGKRSSNCYLCHFGDASNSHCSALVRLIHENDGSRSRKKRRRESMLISKLNNIQDYLFLSK